MTLDGSRRERIETYVRPLYVELDGLDTFSSVDRRRQLSRRLLGEAAIDEEYLELLLLFHGTAKSLGSTGPGGRWWLYLRSLGVADAMLQRVSHGLGRWRESPRGLEEEALHDAELLESVGVVASARRLWWAGRKRVDFFRVLSTLDAGPVPERFRTLEGKRRAAQGRDAAKAWLESLRAAAKADAT